MNIGALKITAIKLRTIDESYPPPHIKNLIFPPSMFLKALNINRS
jgi:hypothetical protein